MINLFIDANIWLSLYDYKNDTLKEFESLKDLLNSKIHLLVSDQVYDEVLRNRDGRIKEAWNRFSQKDFQINAPNFCKEYAEYKLFRKQVVALEKQYEELKKIVDRDIRNHCLEADKLLFKLFDEIEKVSSSTEIISQAKLRYNSGNPPGKDGSLGDAINWELLLRFAPNKEDLYIISEDKDFCSRFDKKVFNLFLEKEWNTKKESNIIFFNTLHDFLNNYAKTLPSQPDTSESGKNNGGDIELRKKMLRISKAMKDEEKRIEKEQQDDYYSKSVIYNILSKRNPSIDLFIKYLTLTNNIQAEINKRDIIQPKDEESSIISSIDNLELDQAGEEEDSSLSVKDDSSPEQQEKDCSQTPTGNQDTDGQHDDPKDMPPLDGQDID